jgi:hypothetical protein
MAGSTISTIPLVKRTVVAVIQAAVDPVQVTYGYAGEKATAEAIYVGNVINWTQVWSSTSNRKRTESYDIEVTLDVFKAGKSQQVATERAFDLIGLIEQALRPSGNDRTLGLGADIIREAIEFRPKGEVQEGLSPDLNARATRIEFFVAVKAQIV